MKKRPEKKTDDFALRHIFTWAADGSIGSPGFQSVSWASDLQKKGLLEKVEDLVESYSSPAADEPPCRQLMLIPETDAAYALTVFTPLPDSPEGRTGNFWAETLVVQGKWLEQGDWDAAAAFKTLPWWGPRPLGELKRDLPLETLSPLQPGDLQRLARLTELVPDTMLNSLLLAVVQQSNGFQRLHLLEADRQRPGDLQEIVTLLPLVVPPTLRTYFDAGQLRCLTLRTRSPRAMLLPADITGHPAATEFDLLEGVVVDLGGRLQPPRLRDSFGRDYVQVILRILRENDWDTFARFYEGARKIKPGPLFFSTFKPLLEAMSQRSEVKKPEKGLEVPETLAEAVGRRTEAQAPRPSQTPVPAEAVASGTMPETQEEMPPPSTDAAPPAAPINPLVPSPIQVQKEARAFRTEQEGAVWNLLESHRKQLKKLVEELQGDFKAELQAADESLRKQLTNLADDAKKRSLEQSAPFTKAAGDLKGQVKELTKKVADLAKRLQALESDRSTAGAKKAEPVSEVLPSEEKPQERESSTVTPQRKSVREWLYNGRWVAKGVGVTIVLLATWLLGPRDGVQQQNQYTPTPGPTAQQRAAALVERVRDGGVAARLLAAIGEPGEFADPVHRLALAIGLNRGITIIEGELDCALLQAALAMGQSGIPVDGVCGERTITALVKAPTNDCCLHFDTPGRQQQLQQRKYCVLANHLQLGSLSTDGQPEACSGEFPWRKGRSWTPDEARRALTLFRDAAEAVDESREPKLADALRGLDPAQSPRLERLEGETLTPAEAKSVLELAWAVRNLQQPRPFDQLSDAEIEGLERYVDALTQNGQGAAEGGP